MTELKIDCESYRENEVQGSTKILAACFNIAATSDTTINNIIDCGYDLYKSISRESPDDRPIFLSEADETCLKLTFMQIAQKMKGVYYVASDFKELAEKTNALFDKAVEKKIISPAPRSYLL